MARFKLQKITDDIAALLKKRVYDLAGIFNSKVAVYLNDKKLPIKKFLDYVNLYVPEVEGKHF